MEEVIDAQEGRDKSEEIIRLLCNSWNIPFEILPESIKGRGFRVMDGTRFLDHLAIASIPELQEVLADTEIANPLILTKLKEFAVVSKVNVKPDNTITIITDGSAKHEPTEPYAYIIPA